MRATPGRTLFSSIISKAQNEVIRKREAGIISSQRVSHTRAHEFISPFCKSIQVFARAATLRFVMYICVRARCKYGKNCFHTQHVDRAKRSQREIGAAEIYCG
jgi:hypothetical protein